MRKKKQTPLEGVSSRVVKSKRDKTVAPSEKSADEAWERLMKIREELGKVASFEKSTDKVMERLAKIGEKLGKDWQSEKSAGEILSEMRR